MARKQPKRNKKPLKKTSVFYQNRQNQFVLSVFIMLIAFLLLFAFISFFSSWQADQSTLTKLASPVVTVKNWLGKLGAYISNFFIFKGFGIGTFVFPVLLFFTGLYI